MLALPHHHEVASEGALPQFVYRRGSPGGLQAVSTGTVAWRLVRSKANLPEQNLHSSAQYEAKRISPEQNTHSSAQYEAKRTSHEQNLHSSAQ